MNRHNRHETTYDDPGLAVGGGPGKVTEEKQRDELWRGSEQEAFENLLKDKSSSLSCWMWFMQFNRRAAVSQYQRQEGDCLQSSVDEDNKQVRHSSCRSALSWAITEKVTANHRRLVQKHVVTITGRKQHHFPLSIFIISPGIHPRPDSEALIEFVVSSASFCQEGFIDMALGASVLAALEGLSGLEFGCSRFQGTSY